MKGFLFLVLSAFSSVAMAQDCLGTMNSAKENFYDAQNMYKRTLKEHRSYSPYEVCDHYKSLLKDYKTANKLAILANVSLTSAIFSCEEEYGEWISESLDITNTMKSKIKDKIRELKKECK